MASWQSWRGAGLCGPARKGTRPVFFGDAGRYVDCAVYDRLALQPGAQLRGPAVIEEPESTVVLGPAVRSALDHHGNLLATLPAARRAAADKAAA